MFFGVFSWVRLLPILHGQIGPLFELHNYLWSGEVAGCVHKQGGTTGWTPQLGKVVGLASQTLLVSWDIGLCFYTRWWCWLDSMISRDKGRASSQKRSLAALCSAFGQGPCLVYLVRRGFHLHHEVWLPGDCENALWLDGVIVWAFSSDGSAGFVMQLGRVTGWGRCLSKAIGRVQKSGRGIGWALQFSSIRG